MDQHSIARRRNQLLNILIVAIIVIGVLCAQFIYQIPMHLPMFAIFAVGGLVLGLVIRLLRK